MAGIRTSVTNPIQIAELAAPGGGVVGLTFCPGKRQPGAVTGAWARDLGTDLRAIREWGAATVLTLVTADELTHLDVETLGDAVEALGMRWLHLPIEDFSVPTADWERQWARERGGLGAELDQGGRILIHCKGGLGRAGTIAARVLVERGMSPDDAIRAVRRVRPGAIENDEQRYYLKGLGPPFGKGPEESLRLVSPRSPRDVDKRADLATRPSPEAGVTDRAIGALVGLAIGDALGTTLEFTARDSRPHHTEMIGGGPFNLAPGVWTDHTSMALALADSLVSVGRLDEKDLMTRFLRWWRDGDYSPIGRCFDIGGTTRAALAKFERTGDPIAANRDPYMAGNGSLMRLSPVAIFYRNEPGKAVEAARRQSATTHAAPECLAACAFYAGLLVRAINGETKDQILAPSAWPEGGAVGKIAAGSWRSKTRAQIRSSGYVIHSLEAALWVIGGALNFEDAVVTAVNLGDDADTVGAITGQLAGAIWGASAIPHPWLDKLAWRDRIEAQCLELTERGTATG